MSWDWLLTNRESGADIQHYLDVERSLHSEGNLRLAASAYDLAYGLAPTDETIRVARQAVLDSRAVVEYGITFRYILAGTFLMGSTDGDPDEQPVHSVRAGNFWLSETQISWEQYRAVDTADFAEQFRRNPRTIVPHKMRYCYSHDNYSLKVDGKLTEPSFAQKPMVAVTSENSCNAFPLRLNGKRRLAVVLFNNDMPGQ